MDALKESLPNEETHQSVVNDSQGLWGKVASFFTGSSDEVQAVSTCPETIMPKVDEPKVDEPKVDVEHVAQPVLASAAAEPEGPEEHPDQHPDQHPTPEQHPAPEQPTVHTEVQTNENAANNWFAEQLNAPVPEQASFQVALEALPPLQPIQQPPVQQPPVQQQEQYAVHRIERPEIAIPCFKNLPVEVLYELIRDGQMFAPDIFEENYDALPAEFKNTYVYEPVQMMIDEVPEVIAFRMIRRHVGGGEHHHDDDDDDDDEN